MNDSRSPCFLGTKSNFVQYTSLSSLDLAFPLFQSKLISHILHWCFRDKNSYIKSLNGLEYSILSQLFYVNKSIGPLCQCYFYLHRVFVTAGRVSLCKKTELIYVYMSGKMINIKILIYDYGVYGYLWHIFNKIILQNS